MFIHDFVFYLYSIMEGILAKHSQRADKQNECFKTSMMIQAKFYKNAITFLRSNVMYN